MRSGGIFNSKDALGLGGWMDDLTSGWEDTFGGESTVPAETTGGAKGGLVKESLKTPMEQLQPGGEKPDAARCASHCTTCANSKAGTKVEQYDDSGKLTGYKVFDPAMAKSKCNSDCATLGFLPPCGFYGTFQPIGGGATTPTSTGTRVVTPTTSYTPPVSTAAAQPGVPIWVWAAGAVAAGGLILLATKKKKKPAVAAMAANRRRRRRHGR